jgi:hypothetical protein
MRITQVTDRSVWDTALADLPQAHVLQTWDWGDFKSRWGWLPTRLLFEEAGQPLAAAQILRRRLAPTVLSVSYIPKGPVLDYGNLSLLTQVLATLEQQARAQYSLFRRLTLMYGWAGPEDATHRPRPPLCWSGLQNAGGAIRRADPVRQVMLNLTPDEDLLGLMKAKRATTPPDRRRGIRVHLELRAIWRPSINYIETSQRDGSFHCPRLLPGPMGTIPARRRAHLLLAEMENPLPA